MYEAGCHGNGWRYLRHAEKNLRHVTHHEIPVLDQTEAQSRDTNMSRAVHETKQQTLNYLVLLL